MDDDQINRVYHGEIFTQEGQRRSRERIHWLVENARGTTVLDVGCSQGITSILLARKGFTCLGVDIAAPQIEYARRELEREDPETRSRVRFELMDARDVGGGPYDNVVLGQVLEHDPDPAELIGKLTSLLAEDGRMLISVPYGYQPSADHHHSFYFDNLYTLISRHLDVADLRMLSGFLTCIAVRRPEKPFEFGRRTVSMIEDVLEKIQHENQELKAKLGARSDDVHILTEKLKSSAERADLLKSKLDTRASELKTLKEKLSARSDELRRVKDKLKERAADVQRLKEKLERAKAQPTRPEPEAPTAKVVRKVTEKLKGKASGPQSQRNP